MARIVSKEESKLVLTAEGNWQHLGESATHPGIKRFFHHQIRKDPDGGFYLYNSFDDTERGVTLEEHVYFEVEDTAYFVEHFTRQRDRFVAELNTGAREPIAAFFQNDDGIVYAKLKNSDIARFSRHALTELEPFLDSDDDGVYVKNGDRRMRVGHNAQSE